MDTDLFTAGEDHPFWRDREATWAEEDEWDTDLTADDVVIVKKKPEIQ